MNNNFKSYEPLELAIKAILSTERGPLYFTEIIDRLPQFGITIPDEMSELIRFKIKIIQFLDKNEDVEDCGAAFGFALKD